MPRRGGASPASPEPAPGAWRPPRQLFPPPPQPWAPRGGRALPYLGGPGGAARATWESASAAFSRGRFALTWATSRARATSASVKHTEHSRRHGNISLASPAENSDMSEGDVAPSAASLDARHCKATAPAGSATFAGAHRDACDRHVSIPHADLRSRRAAVATCPPHQYSRPLFRFPCQQMHMLTWVPRRRAGPWPRLPGETLAVHGRYRGRFLGGPRGGVRHVERGWHIPRAQEAPRGSRREPDVGHQRVIIWLA